MQRHMLSVACEMYFIAYSLEVGFLWRHTSVFALRGKKASVLRKKGGGFPQKTTLENTAGYKLEQ